MIPRWDRWRIYSVIVAVPRAGAATRDLIGEHLVEVIDEDPGNEVAVGISVSVRLLKRHTAYSTYNAVHHFHRARLSWEIVLKWRPNLLRSHSCQLLRASVYANNLHSLFLPRTRRPIPVHLERITDETIASVFSVVTSPFRFVRSILKNIPRGKNEEKLRRSRQRNSDEELNWPEFLKSSKSIFPMPSLLERFDAKY